MGDIETFSDELSDLDRAFLIVRDANILEGKPLDEPQDSFVTVEAFERVIDLAKRQWAYREILISHGYEIPIFH